MKLKNVINKLIKKARNIFAERKNTSFVDLTPVDNADPDGSYARALSFAFARENPHINNVALTGPYGSGKSSIIRTFEKSSGYKFLNISLASFTEDDNHADNTILIERSILQQMLYGADANKLPYSRFKRITIPAQPLFKSMLMVSWPIAAFFLYHYRNELLDFETFFLNSFGSVLLLSFVVSLPVVVVSDTYKMFFGLSLKKLSLKNVEIETSEHSEQSILNRYLDEIIYFFRVTDYDVVVIEDLDRHNNPEIFVKLREINKLINDNYSTGDRVIFLYAIRDNMFAHKKRTKFFDFIIPVVPIINSSNSLDMMQERLNKCGFSKDIEMQFLREVSLYIDDFRLIHNIFNEFLIYYRRLKSDSLDITKLLAMMVYKNVYPNDFEDLHHGKGEVFEIFSKIHVYRQEKKGNLKEQLDELGRLLELAEADSDRSVQELMDSYIGYIVRQVDVPVAGVFINGNHVLFSKAVDFEQFSHLISENNIYLVKNFNEHYSNRIAINKSFSQVEDEINPGDTFINRKKISRIMKKKIRSV